MILVLTEHVDGRLKGSTYEALTFARQLAEAENEVGAALIGTGLDALARELTALKLGRIFLVDDPQLSTYAPQAQLAALEQVLQRAEPAMVVAGHSSTTSDILPRLAARLGLPLVSGCVDFHRQEGSLFLTRQIFNGKIHMRLAVKGPSPCLATIVPGAFGVETESVPSEEPAGAADIVRLDLVELPESPLGRQKLLGREEAPQGPLDFGSASTIVAAGRAIKGKENLSIIEDLATALGAAVGASRPVVDAEWLPRAHQIGSSGQTVSPKLYFAIGISGAIQHVVGMQSSQCIVAINKDPDAPIFKVAHYGIVGDLFEIVPEITKTVKQLNASSR